MPAPNEKAKNGNWVEEATWSWTRDSSEAPMPKNE